MQINIQGMRIDVYSLNKQ